jgi:hypothetical protein
MRMKARNQMFFTGQENRDISLIEFFLKEAEQRPSTKILATA